MESMTEQEDDQEAVDTVRVARRGENSEERSERRRRGR